MNYLLTFLFILACLNCSGQREIDSLEAVVNKNARDIPTARAYNLLASRYARTDPVKSIKYASRAYDISRETNHELSQSAALSIYVSYFQNAGVEDSARYYLDELEKLAGRAVGNEKDVVKGNFHSTAGLYYKRIGNLKQALPHFRNSIYYTEKSDRKLAVAGQSLNLANTYLTLGNYKDALEFYFKALEKFELLGNKEGQSFCLQGLGNSFIKLKQYDKARLYVKRSFEMKKQAGDKKGLLTAYVSMGQIALDTKDFKNAKIHFAKALEYSRSLNIVTEERDIAYNLGKVHAAVNDPVQAENYFIYARKMAMEAGDEVTRSAADMEIIALHKQVKAKDSSENKLRTSVAKLENLGDVDQTLSGYLHLSKYYEDKEDFEKAFHAKQLYYNLRDSIKGNELMLALGTMEEKYNSEKKEKEIAQLKRDQVIAEARIKEQKLLQYGLIFFIGVAALVAFLLWNRYKLITQSRRQAELEHVRNNIARDLHDDIGSTLSSINILSKVMLDASHTVNISGLQKIREHSGNIMESMGDIVWAINPVNDTFEKLISRMNEFASEILEPLNISYNFKIDPALNNMKLDPARKKDIFLIFKESINNAAKYSGCTEINISIEQFNREIKISISDNGKGIGTDVTAGKGNGLKNIYSRAAALAGDAYISRTPGHGTEVLINLPVT